MNNLFYWAYLVEGVNFNTRSLIKLKRGDRLLSAFIHAYHSSSLFSRESKSIYLKMEVVRFRLRLRPVHV